MRGRWILTLTMGAALAAAAPVELSAQGSSQRGRQQQPQRMDAREAARREAERERLRRERERDERARVDAREAARRRAEWERDRQRDQRNRGRYDDWGVWDDGRGRNGGPAFCRSGRGHPVHGRQWCREKGFGLGSERWEQDRWGDILLRDRYRRTQQYGRASLADLLGTVLVGRFENYGRRFGSGPLHGAWLPESGGTVLQLSIAGSPIAHLVDYNRDGRIDNLLLRR